MLRRRTRVAPRELIARLEQEQDDAELRYHIFKRDKRRHQPRLTYDRIKITTVLCLKKNKSLHSVLKTWWMFKRIIKMDQEKQKQWILSLAIVAHVIGRNKRGAKLQTGLAKIMALVFLPFMVPPAIVLGVPALVLFLPQFALVWAILTLNRSAKKVLLQNRRVTKQPTKGNLSQRLFRHIFFRKVSHSSISKNSSIRTGKDAKDSTHITITSSTDTSSNDSVTAYTNTIASTSTGYEATTESASKKATSLRVVTFAPPGIVAAANTTSTSARNKAFNPLPSRNKRYIVRPAWS
jgi:hypothetical protein